MFQAPGSQLGLRDTLKICKGMIRMDVMKVHVCVSQKMLFSQVQRYACQDAVAHRSSHVQELQSEGMVFPGSTLSDHCLRYENIPQIKLIVVLGELGGQDEYSLVR